MLLRSSLFSEGSASLDTGGKISSVCWQQVDSSHPRFGSQSQRLLVAGSDKEVSVMWYDGQEHTATPAGVPVKHEGDVVDVCMVREDLIATASSTGAINMFSVHEQQDEEMKHDDGDDDDDDDDGQDEWQVSVSPTKLGLAKAHRGPTTALDVQRLSKSMVASTGEDGALRVWNLGNGGLRCTVDIPGACTSAAYAVRFTSTSTLVLGGMSCKVSYWDIRGNKNVSGGHGRSDRRRQRPANVYADAHSAEVTCLAAHPRREHVFAAGSANGILNVWDLRNESSPLCSLKTHEASVSRVMFVSDAPSQIVSSGEDGTVMLYDFNQDQRELDIDHDMYSSSNAANIVAVQPYACNLPINAIDYDPVTKTIACGTDSELVQFLF